jgi:WD40 repeat protein
LVALKMIRHAHFATAEERDRFQREARAVAGLSHPNIVQIYEVGEHQGLPFFSLELCEGGSLDEALRTGPLPPAQAAELVEVVAGAMQHAHQRGIVHRDLKPANVLLAAGGLAGEGAKPQAAVPKITDFGLAKRLGVPGGQTHRGVVLGTPQYMAPEQAAGQNELVGPAADVYALGAILFECLTGRPPFQAASLADLLVQVAIQEPVPPSRLAAGVPRDLDVICLKCLEKEPSKRYATAGDLEEDLRRFLQGRPILARPASLLLRTRKWARRQPIVAGLSAALVLGGTLALAVLAGLWQRAERAREEASEREVAERSAKEEARAAGLAEAAAAARARQAREQAEARLYDRNVVQADQRWLAGNLPGALELLEGCPSALRGWEWRFLQRRHREAEQAVLARVMGRVRCLAYHPGGDRLAVGTGGGQVRLVDAKTGRTLWTQGGHKGGVTGLAFTPDGRQLVSAGEAPLLELRPIDRVVVRDADNGKPIRTLPGHTCVAFAPGKGPGLLASAGAWGAVLVWDLSSGKQVQRLAGQRFPVKSVAFAGRDRLAAADLHGVVTVWDLTTGKVLCRPHKPIGLVNALAGSPDGQRLAGAGGDQVVRLWDAATGAEVGRFHGHTGRVESVAFHPAGKTLASGGWDRVVRLWDADTGRERVSFPGHVGVIEGLAFRPDGRRLAWAGWDGTVALRDPSSTPGAVTLTGGGRSASALTFGRDGQLAAGYGDGTIWVSDQSAQSQTLLGNHKQGVRAVAFLAGGTQLAVAGVDGSLSVWDRSSREEIRRWSNLDAQAPFLATPSVTFSADGEWAASGAMDGRVVVWDVGKGKEAFALRGARAIVTCVAFSPDRRRLAAGKMGVVEVWEAQPAGTVLRIGQPVRLPVMSLAFSPDRARLAASTVDGAIRVWDVRKGEKPRLLHTLLGHANTVADLTFSPDGRRLASASWDGSVRLWDPRRGEQLLHLRAHAGSAYAVRFGPSGRRLATCGFDGLVKVWDARVEGPGVGLTEKERP